MRRRRAMTVWGMVVALLWIGVGAVVERWGQRPAAASDLFDKLKKGRGDSTTGKSGGDSAGENARQDASPRSQPSGGTDLFRKSKDDTRPSGSDRAASYARPRAGSSGSTSGSSDHTTLFDRLARPRPSSSRPGGHPGYFPSYYYDYYYDRPYWGDLWYARPYPRYDYRYPRYSYEVDVLRSDSSPRSDSAYSSRSLWDDEAPYYGAPLLADSPQRALQDLAQGWLEEDGDLIMRHTHPGQTIDIYLKGRRSHTLNDEEFHEATLEAFERVETSQFTVREVKKGKGARPYVDARVRHVFFDQEERVQTVEVRYRLEQDPQTGQWFITRVGFGSRPSGTPDCFVATAAYGSAEAIEVGALRRFRDQILLPNWLGRVAVNFYYRSSPPLAAWLRRHENARRGARWMLRPLAWIADRYLAEGRWVSESPGDGG